MTDLNGQKHLLACHKPAALDDEGAKVMCEAVSYCALTTVSNDPNDLEPLTLNQLLQLKVQPVLLRGLFRKKDRYFRRQW